MSEIVIHLRFPCCYRKCVTDFVHVINYNYNFIFTSESEQPSSKSGRIAKVLVPFGIHIESGWANAGLNAL